MTLVPNDTEKFVVPQEDYIHSGHGACAGCGAALTIRYVLKILGPKTIIVVPASCFTGIAGAFAKCKPDSQLEINSSLDIPVLHCAFETGGSTATGVKAGLEAQGDYETTVLVYAGDGGTFDIGLQSLSAAAERNEDILYVCYDNEAYMNTGIQRSGATPEGAWTMTTPVAKPKEGMKKNIVEILAAHRIPYIATATPSFPTDLMKKVAKAKQKKGTKFLHILSPCPVGWRFSPALTIKVSRMAVETKLFPLYEIEKGENYRITYTPKGIPVKDYLELQDRFTHLTNDRVAQIQKNIDQNWASIVRRASETTMDRQTNTGAREKTSI